MKLNLFVLVTISFLAPNTVFAQQGVFTVQVAAKRDQPVAAQITQSLKERGLSAFFTSSRDINRNTFYRINVGHLPNKAKAQQFKNKLVAKYGISPGAFVRELKSEKEEHGVISTPISAAQPEPTPLPVATPTPPPIPVEPAQTPEPIPASTPSLMLRATPTPQPSPSAQPAPVMGMVVPPSPWALLVGGVTSFTNYSVQFPSSFVGTGPSNSLSSTSQAGFGFGILPSYNLSTNLSLESGLMLFQRNFNVNYNNGVVTEPGSESYTALEIPLLLYYKILSHLQLGIGGYYLLNPTGSITQSTFGGPAMPDSNLNGNDWGVAAALNYSLPLSSQSDLLLSGRYNYGNGNFASAGGNLVQNFSDLQLLIGLRYTLLSK